MQPYFCQNYLSKSHRSLKLLRTFAVLFRANSPMKILSIAFQNLQSLRGKHSIRFDEAPLSEASIFAIVGPTGAGKTTILDAISLSLYGKVPRYEAKQAEGKKLEDVMTRHTGEVWTEIEFEVSGVCYRSRWGLWRAGKKADGKPQSAKMELYQFSPTLELIIDGSKVPNKIAELTGLGYSQFTRAVILSQGDFAAFLKSDKDERGELLEKIVGGDIFRRISAKAYQITKAESETLKQLKGALLHIDLLTNDQIAALQQNISAYEEQAKEIAEESQSLRENLGNWKQFNDLQENEQKQEKILQQARNNSELLQTQREKLTQHEKAEPLRNALNDTNDLYRRMEEKEKERRETETEWQKCSNDQATAYEMEKQNGIARENRQEAYNKAQPIIDQAITLEATLSVAKKTAIDAQKSLDEAQKHHKEQVEKQKLKQKEQNEAQKRLSDAEQWLAQNERYADAAQQLPLLQEQARQYAAAQEKSERARRNKDGVAKQISTLEVACQQLKEQWEQAQSELEAHQQQAQKRQAAFDQLPTRETIEQERDALQDSVRQLAGLLSLAEQYSKGVADIAELRTKYQKQKEEWQDINAKIATLNEQLETEKQLLATYDQIRQLQYKIAAYETDRHALQAEQPCPLCGSLHHPYTENLPPNHSSQAEADYQNQEVKVKKLQAELDAQEKHSVRLKIQKDALTQEGKKKSEENKTTAQMFEQQAAELPNLPAIGQLEQLREYDQKQQLQISELKSVLEKIDEAGKDLQQAKDGLRNAEKRQTDLHLSHQQAIKDLQNAQDRYETSTREAAEQQQTLGQLTDKLLQQLQKYADKNKQLLPELLSRIDEWLKYLSKQSQQYENYQKDRQNAQNQISACRAALDTHDAEIARSEESKKKLQAELEQKSQEHDDLYNRYQQLLQGMELKNPQKERERLEKTLREAQENHNESLRIYEQLKGHNRMLGGKVEKLRGELTPISIEYDFRLRDTEEKALARGFSTLLALCEAILDPHEAQNLRQELQTADQTIATAQAALQTLQTDIERLAAKLPAEDPDTLAAELDKLNQQHQQIHRDIGSFKQILTNNEVQREKYREKMKEVDTQQKKYDRWERLNKLIGSADGSKYSRFAQSLTLENLIHLANRHLSLLNDRYSLLQIGKEKEEPPLELEIIDHYYADATRSMRSLSGGETFLVSLALALGLSDLASRNAQIRSLFIDEGFGTLDESTLRIVINTLESLQAQGRTVGIVSHVKELKESITTRIEVRKDRSNSTLHILTGE